jgi:voltage-gated potassium channel
VTVTTTGYGDIAPVSSGVRAWRAFAVTPLRILFLILLVGTTLQLLTERFRSALAENRWRRRVKDHVIVTGSGTKGRGAVDSLRATGSSTEQIVIVDLSSDAVEDARAQGLTAVLGDATRAAVLREAMVTVSAAEIGGPVQARPGELPLAIVRGGERIAFDDDRWRSVQPDDVVVSVQRG